MFRLGASNSPQACWVKITITPQCIVERVGSDGDVALVAQQIDDSPLTCCDGQAVDDLDVARIEWALRVRDGSRCVLAAAGDNCSVGGRVDAANAMDHSSGSRGHHGVLTE